MLSGGVVRQLCITNAARLGRRGGEAKAPCVVLGVLAGREGRLRDEGDTSGVRPDGE